MNRRREEHKRPENYHKILCHYGHKNQIIQTIQELSELSVELTEYLLDQECGDVDIKLEIRLEMADVENMLEQMKLIFGDTWRERETKMIRQLRRMEK